MSDSPLILDNYTCLTMQKYLVVVGSILISLTIGSVYTFGNLLPYFTSYIAYSNRNSTSDLQSIYSQYHYQTTTIYCLLMIFQSISMSFGNTSKVYLIFGFQRSCLLGCFIISFGIGLTYFTCDSLFLSCLTYGIMVGIGCGIVYPTLIICCMSWWPNKKQLMAAIISCSYGMGPFIFNMVQSYFINPNNIKQNKHFGYMQQEQLMYDFPDVFVLIALVFSLMQIIGILCLRNPSSELYSDPNTPYIYNTVTYNAQHGNSLYISPIHLGKNAVGDESTQNAENGSFDDLYYNYSQYNRNMSSYKSMMNNDTDYTVTECFYLWEFWKLFIITMLNIIICLFIVVLYQDFSFNYLGINNPLYLSIIGSVSSIFHGLFRLLYSFIYEYGNNSFQKSNGTTSVIVTCFVATLSLCKYSPSSMIFIWCIVLFSCLGSIYTFIPKCIVATFGVTNCTEISSVIMLSEIPAAMIFAAISTNLVNSIHAYNNVLIILCVFGIISVILTLSFAPENVPKKKPNKVPKNKRNNNAETSQNGYNETTVNRTKQITDTPSGVWYKYESCIPPYLAVIGGLLIMMTIGTTFCFGNIKPYIASYLASKACHGSECNNDDKMKHLYQTYSHRTNWIFCIAVIFEAFASVIGGKLEMYLGAEYCALLGTSIMSLGCALTRYTINNIFGVIVTYGIFFGFGAGIAYPCVVVCVMKWWPRNVGVATGFIYAGFGFGAFIFDLVQTLYINPGNVRDDQDLGFLHDKNILDKVPQMFLFIASVFMTMQILGVILLSSNTPYFRNGGEYNGDQTFSEYNHTYRNTSVQSSKIYGNSTSFDSNISTGLHNIVKPQTPLIQAHDNVQVVYDVPSHTFRPSEAFCTFKFWQLFVISTLNIVVFLFITSEWKVFMFHYLDMNNDHFASFVGSISALCNGIFRILWGIYYDITKSFAISMGTMTICLTIFTGTLTLCSRSPNLMIVWWFPILFSCIGGSYSFYPKVVASTFGYTYSGVIIGCLLLAQIPAAFTFILITNFVDNEVHSSWVKMTIVIAILSFISAILSITYRIPSDKPYDMTKGNGSRINNNLYNFEKQYHITEFIGSKGSKDEREFGDFDQEFIMDANYNANENDNETVCSDMTNISKNSMRSSLSHNK